jgi:hypothetical protein
MEVNVGQPRVICSSDPKLLDDLRAAAERQPKHVRQVEPKAPRVVVAEFDEGQASPNNVIVRRPSSVGVWP